MKILCIGIIIVLTGCSSPEDDSRVLLGDARKAYENAKIFTPDKTTYTEEEFKLCIENTSIALKKIEEVHTDYPASRVSNEPGTHSLRGKIKSRLKECEKRLKRFQK